jgi:flavodoxin I
MMEKIGIFYCSFSGNSQVVAEMIQAKAKGFHVDLFDIFETSPSSINGYKNLIFGVPTWEGENIPDDWKIFLNALDPVALANKKVALYGLGDQVMFDETFADSLGLLYEALIRKKCKVIGFWPSNGYVFSESKALVGDDFVGLVIDEDNQGALTEERIERWLQKILPDFNNA